MAKRVFELARELGVESKDIVAALKAAGIEKKAVSSLLPEEEILAKENLENGDEAGTAVQAPAPIPAVLKRVMRKPIAQRKRLIRQLRLRKKL